MIYHVFNSALVSGPETLVLPNLVGYDQPVKILLLQEARLEQGAQTVQQYAQSLGFETTEISVRGRFDLAAIKKIGAHLKKNPPKILHAHGPKATLFCLWALKLSGIRSKVKLLTTHHGVRANDTQVKLKFFEILYEKTVIPFCDLCFTVCTSDKTLLASRGIRANKLEVHLNGVDRALFDAETRADIRTKVRKEWAELAAQPIEKDFLVGVVGRLAKEKQYPLLLQGIRQLLDKRPEAKLKVLCFGSGPMKAELEALTHSLGLKEHVFWMGYRGQIAKEMNALDLLLSTSSAEGLPINLIEAGWAGIPVIAHAVDGINDLIESGASGELLKSPLTAPKIADALEVAYMQPEKNRALASNFQKRVIELFSKKAWVEKLSSIYKRFQ